jgi:hypothetical protein
MRARRTALLIVLVPFACSPAATPTPKGGPTVVPTVAKVGEAVPETPARWVMRASREWRPTSKLTFGGSTVYAGRGGERWLGQKGGGRLSHAIKLLPEDVEAVVQMSGKFLFAGTSGAIYAAAEPLGPIVSTNAPPAEMRSITAGRAAIVGVTSTGELLRTLDGGAKWTKPSGLPKANGVLVRVALDGTGTGLALMTPQRLFLTKDDGDTWLPLTTPGIGASNVVTDMTGSVFLMGGNENAVLSSGSLTQSGQYPKFELPSKPGEEEESGYSKVYAVTGNRFVEAYPFYDPKSAGNKWKLRAGPFGTVAKGQIIPALDGCNEVQLAAYDNTIVLACDLKTSALLPGSPPGSMPYPRTESTRFIRSDDFGATFRDDVTVESADPRSSQATIAVGPGGWLFINTRCHWTKKGQDCLPARIRPAGSDSFQTMTVGGLPVGGSTKKNGWSSDMEIRDLHFVPSKGMVYVLANRRGEHRVYAAKLGETEFVRKLDSEMDSGWGESAFSVEDDGTIALMAREQGLWTLRRAKEDGTLNQSMVVPIEFDKVELHGRRGLGFDTAGKGWETADSGQHWTEVAAPVERGEPRFIACTSFGCLLDGKLRVGWDLPTVTTGKVVAAIPVVEAVKPTMSRRGKPAVIGGKTVFTTPLRCSVKEHWTTVGPWMPQYGQWLPGAMHADVAPGVRWMIDKRGEAGRVSVVVTTPAPSAPTAPKSTLGIGKPGLLTKEYPVLGPEPEDDKLVVTTKEVTRPGGLVAVRYAFRRKEGQSEASYGSYGANDKDLSPVDVEVGWFDAATLKTHKATLKQVAPFRVPVKTSYDPALVWPAKGGVWFHVQIREAYVDKGPLFFLHDDGKVDKMTWPEGAQTPSTFGVDRVGGRVVIYQVQDNYNGQLQMFWSTDSGATWTKRQWGIAPGSEFYRRGEETRRVQLQSIEGLFDKLSVGVSWSHAKTEVAFGVPLSMDNDPAEVSLLPAQKTQSDPPKSCDATAATGARVVANFGAGTRHPVIVTGEIEKGYLPVNTPLVLATSTAVLRVQKTGAACVSAYELNRDGAQFSGILAPNDLANASLFYRDSAPMGGTLLVTRPMTCAFEAAPLPEELQEEEGILVE